MIPVDNLNGSKNRIIEYGFINNCSLISKKMSSCIAYDSVL